MWTNWAGNTACQPRRIATPRSEEEVAALVQQDDGARNLRVAGAGHSFTPLCATDDTLVSLDGLQGLVAADASSCEATVWAGTKISHLGEPLRAAGLALDNQGDVDYQTLAGAVATGTHGTGITHGSLPSCVTRLRLVLASGEIVTCSATSDPELFRAAQVSLGQLGIVTQITMRVVPAYRLHERTWVASFEETMDQLDEQVRANDHFEFFWLPQHDAAALKALNHTASKPFGALPSSPAPAGTLARYVQPERIDWSYRIFPSPRTIRFVEMEFAVPFAHGPDCLRDLRRLILAQYPWVSWPIEYRTLRADDIFLSPSFEQDSVTISIHEAPDAPYHAYFAAAEVIFRAYGGRPHWGKLHSYSAPALRRLYPLWDRFQAVRERVDPEGRFLNPYLRTLMLDE